MDYTKTLNAISAAKEAHDILLNEGLCITDFVADNNGVKFTVVIDDAYTNVFHERNILLMFDDNDIVGAYCSMVEEHEYRTLIYLKCGEKLKNGVCVTFHSQEFVDVKMWHKYRELDKVCCKCEGVISCDECPIYQWKLEH